MKQEAEEARIGRRNTVETCSHGRVGARSEVYEVAIVGQSKKERIRWLGGSQVPPPATVNNTHASVPFVRECSRLRVGRSQGAFGAFGAVRRGGKFRATNSALPAARTLSRTSHVARVCEHELRKFSKHS